MPLDLREMTVGQRIAVTFVIVLVILFALALFGFFTGSWDEAPAAPQASPDLYGGVPLDSTLLKLDRRALDEAYHQQLLKLWGVWLVEGAKDDKHFRNGLGNARRAYGLALQAINKREQELPK
jgi:hypothetical protein